MTTRPPFTYSTPADIVRIVHFGLQAMAGITDAQYTEALSQLEAAQPTWAVAVYPMAYTVQTFEEWDREQEADDREVEDAMAERERVRDAEISRLEER